MKKAVVALTVAALMLAAFLTGCESESSSCGVVSDGDNTVHFTAENAKDTSATGNITVEDGDILTVAPNLTEGKVNISFTRAGSESEMPAIEWDFEGTEPTQYMPDAGEYDIVFTVSEKTSGTIEIYTMSAEHEGMDGMINPWKEITAEEAVSYVPFLFKTPDGAENVMWSVMQRNESDPALVEAAFELGGQQYIARAQVTGDEAADLSGMYYEWGEPEEVSFANWGDGNMKGKLYTGGDDLGMAKLCTWYDTEIGISYSLGAVGEDLSGVDMQAVADAMFAPENDPRAGIPD
ncbi:MAG: hypothetical protein IKD89_01005 [Clostridia bacterium]|nr:hypothetical protein [Clostridia bacterium]